MYNWSKKQIAIWTITVLVLMSLSASFILYNEHRHMQSPERISTMTNVAAQADAWALNLELPDYKILCLHNHLGAATCDISYDSPQGRKIVEVDCNLAGCLLTR